MKAPVPWELGRTMATAARPVKHGFYVVFKAFFGLSIASNGAMMRFERAHV